MRAFFYATSHTLKFNLQGIQSRIQISLFLTDYLHFPLLPGHFPVKRSDITLQISTAAYKDKNNE
jgi:hypothetical protein